MQRLIHFYNRIMGRMRFRRGDIFCGLCETVDDISVLTIKKVTRIRLAIEFGCFEDSRSSVPHLFTLQSSLLELA